MDLLELSDDLVPASPLEIIDRQGVNVTQRKIYIDDIDEETGTWFLKVRDYLADLGGSPIEVVLNTPGGDVNSMFVFHDAVQSSPVPIHTLGTGMVCSAGVLMLACGHVSRVTESCVWMSHEPSGFGGDGLRLSEARDRRRADDWTQEHWANLMSRHTPRDSAYWKSISKRKAEYWICGGEAIVQAGMADEVKR